ncbi:hypothetical protein BGZ72_005668 [Mortierella alpina]|nr:hypothetical protein BGZ72_005668 [Mortierella alpina]
MVQNNNNSNNHSFRITHRVNQDVLDRSAILPLYSAHVLETEPDSSSPSYRRDPMARKLVEEERGSRADNIPRASQPPSAAPFGNNASAIIDSLLKTHQQLSTSTSTSTESQTTVSVQRQHSQTYPPGPIDSAPPSPRWSSSSNTLQAKPVHSYERVTLSDTAPSTVGDSLESDHYDEAEDEGEEEEEEEEEDMEEGEDSDLFHLHGLHAVPGTKRKPQSEASKKGRSLYACSHPGCGRSFDRRFNRDSHEMTHNPDRQRPFVCSNPDCDQAFMRRHDLQRHEASKHKSVRLFSCQRCNKSFSRQDGLRRHVASKRVCFDKKSHFT